MCLPTPVPAAGGRLLGHGDHPRPGQHAPPHVGAAAAVGPAADPTRRCLRRRRRCRADARLAALHTFMPTRPFAALCRYQTLTRCIAQASATGCSAAQRSCPALRRCALRRCPLCAPDAPAFVSACCLHLFLFVTSRAALCLLQYFRALPGCPPARLPAGLAAVQLAHGPVPCLGHHDGHGRLHLCKAGHGGAAAVWLHVHLG